MVMGIGGKLPVSASVCIAHSNKDDNKADRVTAPSKVCTAQVSTTKTIERPARVKMYRELNKPS